MHTARPFYLARLPIWIACTLPMTASDSRASADPAPLSLPEVVITETINRGREEIWRYTRIAHFEVLSGVPDREARVTLRELDRFARILELVWPAAGDGRPHVPTSLILCGPTTGYFAFLPPDGSRHGESNLLLTGPDRAALIINQEDYLPSDPTLLTEDGGTAGRLHANIERRTIQLYVRLLLASKQARLPLWLEAGLVQTLADIEVHSGWLTYGKINTEQNNATGEQPVFTRPEDFCAPTDKADLSFKQLFARGGLMPLDQFFVARQTNGAEPSFDSYWAKQAYAFVHFCLFGENLRHRDALARFVNQLGAQPPTEEMFRACFGVGYRAMEEELKAYFRHTRHQYQRYALEADQAAGRPDFAFAPATAAQIGRLKGDAAALAGRHDVARSTYAKAYDQGAREPPIIAGYGLALLASPDGDRALARRLIDAAVQAGVDRPAALVAQARLRLDEFIAAAGPAGQLTDQQLALVLAPLFKARSLHPPLAATYATIAEAWAAATTIPRPEHLAVLDEGIRRFPRDSQLLYRAAMLHQQRGSAETAAALAKRGQQYAGSAEDRALFARLLEPSAGPKN